MQDVESCIENFASLVQQQLATHATCPLHLQKSMSKDAKSINTNANDYRNG